MRPWFVRAAVSAVITLVGAAAARADGIIIITPWPTPYPRPEPPPARPYSYTLNINYHHVEVAIVDQVATTLVDEEFENPYDFDVEGTYIFPLPKGAALEEFSLKVDGKAVEGVMLNADEAGREYRNLVNENKDPALLEYFGRGAIKARIPAIPGRAKKRVEVSYDELLPFDGGFVKYAYPLDTERFSARPLEDVAVNVNIKTAASLGSVIATNHKTQIDRPSPREAVVKYHAADVRPAADFVLFFGLSPSEFDAGILAYRPPAGDGYFLLVLTPPVTPVADPSPKEVVFVVDVSGSMAGDKLDQVKRALDYCLEHMRPTDRFNVVAFNETVSVFRDGSVEATAANVWEGRGFINALTAGGGTNVDGALTAALAQRGIVRGASMLVFLTDGKPTVGERNVADILADVGAANAGRETRVFCFGVGYDVKTELLDGLAAGNGGTAQYVEPGEDLERAITSFYRKFGSPALTRPALTWEGAGAYDFYPAVLPDLFAGTQVTVLGRYKGDLRAARYVLTGTRGDEVETFAFDAAVTATERPDNDFVAALWAARKIGFLLEQIKLEGEDKDLVDAVVALSKEYGIPTPYTSYLVSDADGTVSKTKWDSHVSGAAGDAALGGKWADAAGSWGEGGPGERRAPATAAELAVRESRAIGVLKAAATAPSGYDDTGVRYVRGKAFYRRGDAWRETAADDATVEAETEFAFAGDDYFAFLEKHPEAGAYFALGPRLEFVFDGRLYRVTP